MPAALSATASGSMSSTRSDSLLPQAAKKVRPTHGCSSCEGASWAPASRDVAADRTVLPSGESQLSGVVHAADKEAGRCRWGPGHGADQRRGALSGPLVKHRYRRVAVIGARDSPEGLPCLPQIAGRANGSPGCRGAKCPILDLEGHGTGVVDGRQLRTTDCVYDRC